MRHFRLNGRLAVLLAVLAGATVLGSASPARGQSVLERTPNLAAGWTGTVGTVYFNFLHRFWTVDFGDEDKVLNSPTFFLAVPLPGRVLVGIGHSTNSLVDGREFNEDEFFARWTPFARAAGHVIDLSFTGAFNEAANSGDAEISVGIPFGPVKVIAAGRYLSDVFELDEERWAFGGGAIIRLSDHVALAGDVMSLTDRDLPVAGGETDVAWSAALQLVVPYTPHTFSLQVTNARTASLQGSSFGDAETRYGFEFTIPFTLSRYFGGRSGGPSESSSGQVAAEVRMSDQLRFDMPTVTISTGQAVRWSNTSGIIHTVTADPEKAARPGSAQLPGGADIFDSGDLRPGETFTRTFTVPGEYRYFCIPHEGAGMTGTIIVR